MTLPVSICSFKSELTDLYKKPVRRTSRGYFLANGFRFPEELIIPASRRKLEQTLRLLIFEEGYRIADDGIFRLVGQQGDAIPRQLSQDRPWRYSRPKT